ncbi:MAG: hypothetical protein OXC93_02500 [Rhodospirillaceae bacterium]|nr:hypothetical protein [Rhodospirillaceae bacterium]
MVVFDPLFRAYTFVGSKLKLNMYLIIPFPADFVAATRAARDATSD